MSNEWQDESNAWLDEQELLEECAELIALQLSYTKPFFVGSPACDNGGETWFKIYRSPHVCAARNRSAGSDDNGVKARGEHYIDCTEAALSHLETLPGRCAIAAGIWRAALALEDDIYRY